MSRCRTNRIWALVIVVVALVCPTGWVKAGGQNKKSYYLEEPKNEGNVVSVFSGATAGKAERALAQAIGDGFLELGEPKWFLVEAGEVPVVKAFVEPPDPNEYFVGNQEDVCRYAARQLRLTGAEKGEDRAEANLQIQRLWRACAPVLLDNLGHPDPAINEAVMKNLIMMRSERVVEEVIKKIRAAKDENVRLSGIFVLGMMRERREPAIPRRKLLSKDESDKIVSEKVIPFLREIEPDAGPEAARLIRNAYRYLDRPFDLATKQD